MSLTQLVDAKYKSPTAKVTFNGNRTRDLLSISVNSVLEGGLGTASVRTQSNPGINPEAKIQIFQGYNDDNRLTFTGYVDSIEPNELEGTYTVNCRDVLKKAMDTFLIQEIKFGQDIAAGIYYYSTYTSADGGTFTIHEYDSLSALNTNHPETVDNYSSQGVKAHAVVQWLLHMSGLAEGSEIQVDDTNFWIGDLNPAKFHLTSVYDAAQQIANLIGWRIYADAAGVARFKRKPRQPGGYTYWKYTDKGNPYNINKLTKTSTNVDLRNYVEVRGASGIRVVKRATSPYIGNTPYRGVLISEELIDTPGIADFICTRVLQDLNRLKVTLAMDVDGNPFLAPGSTVDVSSRVATGKYLVEQYQTNMSADGGYVGSIGAAAYLGDTKFEEDPTPDIVAVFVPTFVSVLGDPKWIVTLDGAASYSSRGVISRYVWSWPDSTTTDSSNSAATFVFDEAAISNGNSQDVTLTVYDSMGNSGSVTNPITTSGLAAAVSIKYRALYGALTTIAAGSVDGGQTWYTNSIPAISVAASNFAPGGVYVSSGHALFGTSDGKIYKTVDTCVTMTLQDSPGGRVTDIHIPELDSTKAAAVTSTGKVLYSDDSGDTWRLIGSFPVPLREVKMNYTNFKELTIVGSGNNNVWITEDTGGSWARLGVGAYDVLWATDGSQTNYFAHTNGVLGSGPAGVSSLTFSGGGSYIVPAATVMIDRDDGVMIVDSTGQHWTAASGVFYATQNNNLNLTQHMIRDGEMETLVYYATASGISKSLDRNTTMAELYYPEGSMPVGGWGQKVAYGPLAGIVVPGQLVHRGQLLANDLSIIPYGWQIATSSGWVYGCADKPGITAVSTGGIAIGEINTENIHFIQAIPTVGAGAAGIAQLILNENWAESAGVFDSIAFNKRSDSRDMLCLVTKTTEGEIYAEAFPHFITTPSGSSVVTFIDGPGTIRNRKYQETTSFLGDMVYLYNYSNFSPPAIVNPIFLPTGEADITNFIAECPNATLWAPYQKNAAPFKGIVAGPDGAQLCTGRTGSTLVFEDTNLPADDIIGWDPVSIEAFHPLLFSSYTQQALMYYATSAGVYKADNYGQGDQELIFDVSTVLASGTVTSLTVTGSRDNAHDYLCTIVAGFPSVGPGGIFSQHRVYYSTDSGETWQVGPPMYDIEGGEVYFIDI
jgi:hypothetical protein